MPRVLLLLPTSTYRAHDFVAAAVTLGVDVVVGSEERQAMAASMGERSIVVPLGDPEAASEAVAALHATAPVDAVLAVDERGVLAAATIARRLGLAQHHNPVDAVAATRDKTVMRARLAAAGVAQPRFAVAADAEHVIEAAADVGFPCVVKPVGLAASRGVIRADDATDVIAAAQRVAAIVDGPLLVEEYVPGVEVAVEGLLRDGVLEVLAVFDKPDPLVGPFFEETIYVTPSRLPADQVTRAGAVTAAGARALGLREGPVHAEVRLDGARAWVIEVAARSIGGLCSRTLRFGAGISLEQVILRHALGLPLDDLEREPTAAGVMMLPIPSAGMLARVGGRETARAVGGITGLEITIPVGRPVVPLPEGDRYLGFLFARGDEPAAVEASLRAAFACLEIVISR